MWLTLLRSKAFWIAVLLLSTNIFTAYKVYEYSKYKAAAAELTAQLEINKNNLATAKHNEAELRLQFDKMNESARKNAEQKALDDKVINSYDQKVSEILNVLQTSNGKCLNADITRRLYESW